MNGTHVTPFQQQLTNGHDISTNGFDDPSLEALEAELPVVDDDQVPLGEVASRIVQACYAELSEMADTYVLASAAFLPPQASTSPSEHTKLTRTVSPTCPIPHENEKLPILLFHGRNRSLNYTP